MGKCKGFIYISVIMSQWEGGTFLRYNFKPLLILISAILTVAFFQNCASEVPFGSTDVFSALTSTNKFPFEAELDQLAYMSCSEQEDVVQDFQTFFSFRAGAYTQGGVRVTEDFRKFAAGTTGESVANSLQNNTISSDTVMQFAIRAGDNYQLTYLNEESGSEGESGIDYANIFAPLGDENLTKYLWDRPLGQYINVWPGAQFTSQYRFEGTLHFSDSEIIARELRSFLSNNGILALTFSQQETIAPRGPGYMANDPNLSVRDVYGTGLKLRFKQPLSRTNQQPHSSMPSRVLSTVNEVMIDARRSDNVPATWACPVEYSFMIVLPEHAEDQNCPMEQDPVNPSPALNIIRQSLFSEDWHVNLAQRCVVPKPDRVEAGSCYGKNSQTQETRNINYDLTTSCGLTDLNGLCPHYVSICFKIN